jgi:hypothetical protein
MKDARTVVVRRPRRAEIQNPGPNPVAMTQPGMTSTRITRRRARFMFRFTSKNRWSSSSVVQSHEGRTPATISGPAPIPA